MFLPQLCDGNTFSLFSLELYYTFSILSLVKAKSVFKGNVVETDINMVLDKLRLVYLRRKAKALIDYEEVYPVLKVKNRRILGLPIRISRLKVLDAIPHSKRVLSVDAGLKVLFDCGAFKIILAKVAAGMWIGREKVLEPEPIKRITLVWDKFEAAEWLLRVEIEALLSIVHLLKAGDYCILDRCLMAMPAFRKSTKEFFEKLDHVLSSRGAILVGVSKASQLRLNTGESLIGYLLHLADRRLRGVAWYYYPIFRESELPPWYLGSICVAKLGPDVEHAFRIDISRKALASRDIGDILGEVAFLQDPATPGYPYPAKGVHDMTKISEEELEMERMRFLELLDEEGLLKNFIADVRSVTFKERYLWRR